MEADSYSGDYAAYDEPFEAEPDPERAARWGSLALAVLGLIAIVAVAGAVVAALALPSARATFATPAVAVLGAGLAATTFITSLGLVAAGLLLHHGIRRRALTALTYEGLVEETSQEFDRVNARVQALDGTVRDLDARLVKHVDGVTRARRDASPEAEETSSGAVSVNVLPSGIRASEYSHGRGRDG